MGIVIKIKKTTQKPTADIGHLKGTALKLAELVQQDGHYEFEGFNWLQGTFVGIAEQLAVNEKTIRRVVEQSPFHHITRQTKEHGRHILMKLGTDPCETDHVFLLRAIWVRGIVWYNVAAIKVWTLRIELLQAQQADKKFWERLPTRIEAAKKRADDAEKLQAGKRISYQVEPYEMGCLRALVKLLTHDARDVIKYVTTFEGWERFISYTKITDRLNGRYYHWPSLPVIVANPDLALQAYLDDAQEKGKISISQSAVLLAKIAKLAPPHTA